MLFLPVSFLKKLKNSYKSYKRVDEKVSAFYVFYKYTQLFSRNFSSY